MKWALLKVWTTSIEKKVPGKLHFCKGVGGVKPPFRNFGFCGNTFFALVFSRFHWKWRGEGYKIKEGGGGQKYNTEIEPVDDLDK